MNKFYRWLLLFFVMLIAIPVLLLSGWVLFAKILGVFTVLLLSFAVRFWLHQTKKQFDPKERIRINLNDRFWLRRQFPFYDQLSSADKSVFEDRLGIFLARVPICVSSGGLLLDRQVALKICVAQLKELSLSEDFHNLLPAAVILDNGNWIPEMVELRQKSHTQVVLASSLEL